MSGERFCRRCFLIESGREDTLKSIKEHIKKIPPREKSGGEEYNRRLAVCSGCESLVGGVCLKCGCYPEFRAAFIRQKCPCKKW